MKSGVLMSPWEALACPGAPSNKRGAATAPGAPSSTSAWEEREYVQVAEGRHKLARESLRAVD